VVLHLTARHAAIGHAGSLVMTLHGVVGFTRGVAMVVLWNGAVISGAA
jgi:hypothetical protein